MSLTMPESARANAHVQFYICPVPGCGRRAELVRSAVEEIIVPSGGEKPRFFVVHCARHGERLVTVSGKPITDHARQAKSDGKKHRRRIGQEEE